MVDVLRSVVGVQGLDGEGEGGDEGLEEGEEVGLGDVGDRPEVLQLGHLIDHVDDVDPLIWIDLSRGVHMGFLISLGLRPSWLYQARGVSGL